MKGLILHLSLTSFLSFPLFVTFGCSVSFTQQGFIEHLLCITWYFWVSHVLDKRDSFSEEQVSRCPNLMELNFWLRGQKICTYTNKIVSESGKCCGRNRGGEYDRVMRSGAPLIKKLRDGLSRVLMLLRPVLWKLEERHPGSSPSGVLISSSVIRSVEGTGSSFIQVRMCY